MTTTDQLHNARLRIAELEDDNRRLIARLNRHGGRHA